METDLTRNLGFLSWNYPTFPPLCYILLHMDYQDHEAISEELLQFLQKTLLLPLREGWQAGPYSYMAATNLWDRTP
jgi:hypothetical protein